MINYLNCNFTKDEISALKTCFDDDNNQLSYLEIVDSLRVMIEFKLDQMIEDKIIFLNLKREQDEKRHNE